MDFIPEIEIWRDCLEGHGFVVFTPHMVSHREANLPEAKILALKRREAVKHFTKITKSDAILVLNFTKNGVENYIGGAAFAEVAVATFLKKRVFLVNPIPIGMPYSEELRAWELERWDGPSPS